MQFLKKGWVKMDFIYITEVFNKQVESIEKFLH